MDVVIRRNFGTGPLIVPWRVPRQWRTSALRELMRSHCSDSGAAQLALRQYVENLEISQLVRLDVKVEAAVAERMKPALGADRWFDDGDFATAVEMARRQNLEQFGEQANRPY